MNKLIPYLVMIGALACLTSSPVIVRYAQAEAVPSVMIAGSRMVFASILVTPFVWHGYRAEVTAISRQNAILLVGAGIWMALNGMLVISSLEHIPILANQMLASTAPIWAALVETTWLKARFHGLLWAGVALVIVGSLIISGPMGVDQALSPLGIGLALASAVCAALYAVLGRRVRPSISLVPYMWIVYGVGGIFSVGYMLMSGINLWGYSPAGLGWIAASTLIVQLLGFSGMAFALAHLPATLIVLLTRSVAVTSAILAFFLFLEVPSRWQIVGSIILFLGIVSAVVGQEVGNRSTKRKLQLQ
jgi:drug/metabolite transporter (DMT)-like permease